MVEPLTIYGTVLGVIFNIISPSWLIIVVLVLLLGFTTYKTFKKAYTQFKKESEKLKAEKAEKTLNNEDNKEGNKEGKKER